LSTINMKRISPDPATSAPSPELDDLYMRPGVLFRRAHQIAVGIFVQECAALALTPPQHSTLLVIGRRPGLNQAEIARALGFDRATIGQIIDGLESRGLISRSNSVGSKRNKALELTPEGRSLLREAEEPIRRMSGRLLSPLSPGEQMLLVELLSKLTTALNAESRTPLTLPQPAADPES
jgi:DNA-binding MarR family transcriptional regulator